MLKSINQKLEEINRTLNSLKRGLDEVDSKIEQNHKLRDIYVKQINSLQKLNNELEEKVFRLKSSLRNANQYPE